jgi:hypothetical protein
VSWSSTFLTTKRVTGIVSRGGASLAEWMVKNHKQNFQCEYFEDICKIFQKHDVSCSLGEGLRPGSLADASDRTEFAELETLGELTKIAGKHDVQVMIESQGHIPVDQIQIEVEKEVKPNSAKNSRMRSRVRERLASSLPRPICVSNAASASEWNRHIDKSCILVTALIISRVATRTVAQFW